MNAFIAASLVFLIPCAVVAFALALPQPRRWLVRAALLAPALALFAAYGDAALHQRGDKVTLEVHALRIGPARIAAIAPGQTRVLMVVGDRAEVADLVVPSAADPRQAEADLSAEPRLLMQVEGTRDAAGVLAMQLHLLRAEPEPDGALPGMEAVAGTGGGDVITLRPGTEHRVAINRIEPDGARVIRRMLTISIADAGGVRIALDTPLRAAAGSCGLGGGAVRLDLRLQPSTGDSANSAAFASPDRLAFDELGLGGADPLLSPSLLGPVAEPAQVCAVRTGGGGGAFVWPATGGGTDARLELSAHVATLDWFLPLFVLAAALGLMLVPGREYPRRQGEFAAAALAGLLIGYRLLAAIAAPYYDAALDPALVPAESAFGFLAVPLALVAMLRGDGTRADWHGCGLLLAGGTAGLMLWLGAWPGALAVWPAGLAGALIFWRHAGSPPLTARLVVPNWLGKRTVFERAAMLVIAAVTIRFLLALPPLNARERLLGLPLSVPYLAVLMAGFAVMLHQLASAPRDSGPRDWPRVCVVTVLALIATFAIPLWVSDSGFTFLAAPPLLALIGLSVLAAHQSLPGKVIAAAPLVLAPLALWLGSAYLASSAEQIGSLPLFARMEAMLAFSGNELRLIQFADPAALSSIVTRQAFAAIEQQHLLGQLVAGFTGEGWLAPASLYSLRVVQLSDNVAAVHVMWPFGRLAALGLLAAMGGFALAAARGRAGLPAASPVRLASWLASGWLVWAMAYMLCANLLLVPFIGRNIYFLSATSGGDLFEAAMLLVAALWPLRTAAA